MVELQKKSVALKLMLQESSTDLAIIISLYYAVDCMKHDVNVVVRIFHPRIGYQSHLYTYFSKKIARVDYRCHYNSYLFNNFF